MNIAFRVDASSQIGIGHLMRCKTLAEGFVEYFGAKIFFICRFIPHDLKESLTLSGFSVFLLKSEFANSDKEYLKDLHHSHWLGCSQDDDMDQVCDILKDQKIDVVVLDHYALDYRSEVEYKKNARIVVAIDDLADRKHMCEILIDQNIFLDMDIRYKGKCSANTKMLIGPKYAMIRKNFLGHKQYLRKRSGKVKSIMVSLGGADKNNYTKMVMTAIHTVAPDIHADVVIGSLHNNKEEIQKLCDSYAFKLHIQTDKMPEIMLNSDISVGATGSTSWERCFLGLPSLCIVQADNQYPIALGLEHYGAIVNLGYAESLSENKLNKQLTDLIRNPQRVSQMSESAMRLVDGLGVKRIIEELETLQ